VGESDWESQTGVRLESYWSQTRRIRLGESDLGKVNLERLGESDGDSQTGRVRLGQSQSTMTGESVGASGSSKGSLEN
jgi:hypothetical protein